MRLSTLLAAPLIALALASSALAQATGPLPPGVQRAATVEGITEYHLANGLQVLLAPDDSKPSTTVNVTYRVGSRHESYGETGMAHLLEHMLFKGTPTTRNVWGEFTRRGLRANGSTSFDRTNYFASWSASDENLRWYLAWQADAMVNSTILRSDLDSEMTVVRNEMEQGENSPGRTLLYQVMSSMYQWHNHGKAIIGARSDVENVDIPRLQAFYRRYYQPDNATLIVSGRFDEARTLGWIAQFFGPIPRPARTLQPTYTLDPPQDGERTIMLRRVGGNPLVNVAYHITSGSHPDFAAAQVLARVVGDGPGSRLHERLVQRQLAASAFGFAWGLEEPGPLFFGIQLAPGQDVEKARAEMLAALDDVVKQPVTAAELERARTRLLNDWDSGYADPETVGVLLSGAIGLGDWRLFFLDRDRLRAVTLADVQRVAAERLRRDNRTIGTYVPTATPERAPAPQRVDVAAMVKDYKGDARAAAVAAFDPTPANLDARTVSAQLASGLKVALLPKPARGNVVQARLRLAMGDERSLTGRAEENALLAAMLDKGGAGLTRQQIRDRFDQLRAEVAFAAHEQGVQVSIETRRDQLPEVLSLVGRLLREPALPVDGLQELQRQREAQIAAQRNEPDAVSSKALARHGNPYARGDLRYVPTFDEQLQDLRAVTVDSLRAYHRRFYSAAHGEFSAVGDFDAAAVRQALETALADWRTPADGPQAYARVPRPYVAPPPQRLQLATPDKQNAFVRVSLPLPLKELDADFPALLLVNEIFSGGGGSRLWDRMRERDGLSYGVNSAILWNPYEPHSRYAVAGIFAPQNLSRMEAALREEIERARRDGFTASELEQARNGLMNTRRLSRAQDAGLAGALLRNAELGRTFSVSQQVDDAIARLTLDEVNAALRRHLDPSRWSVAWAGDFKP
jgi:zinc protease